MMSRLFTILLCPEFPVLGSGAQQCAVEGFSPAPEGFIKPAPSVDHGISDGEYDEWFSRPEDIQKCEYGELLALHHAEFWFFMVTESLGVVAGTSTWFPESGC
jgi:hypothetical protein